MKQEESQWYTNKQLYEMMVELSKGLEKTNSELGKTQTLIRDYNGLREKVEEHDKQIANLKGREIGSKAIWGYIVGGGGLFFALLTLINNIRGGS